MERSIGRIDDYSLTRRYFAAPSCRGVRRRGKHGGHRSRVQNRSRAAIQRQIVLITLYPAVMISAWLGGLWPGIAATALSAVIADYVRIDPLAIRHAWLPGRSPRTSAVAGVGTVISILTEGLDQGRAREDTARTAAERAEQRAPQSLEAESGRQE